VGRGKEFLIVEGQCSALREKTLENKENRAQHIPHHDDRFS